MAKISAFKAIGGVSGKNEVFNVSKSISYALSGTFYGIEKSFLVVEIWISKVGWFWQLSGKCIGKHIGNKLKLHFFKH